MCNKFSSLVVFCLALTFSFFTLAQTPEEKGLAIAVESDKRSEGYGDSKSSMKMILVNKRGDQSTRELHMKGLDGIDGEGDKSLLVFDTPKDQKGTALLTFSHKDRSDDQWLYLPALKRPKKIASKNKSGPFLGSEFAFEDMSAVEVEKYTYKWLRDETFNGMDCFVVERVPLDKDSGYTKMINWIDKEEYRGWQTEYYDRKKTHLKTLTVSGYNHYNDKFWRPTLMKMVNHQTGKSTLIKWENYEFGIGLNKDDFNKNALQRAK